MLNSWNKRISIAILILIILLFRFCANNIISKKEDQVPYSQKSELPKASSLEKEVISPMDGINQDEESVDFTVPFDESSIAPMPVFYKKRQISEIEVFNYKSKYYLKKTAVFDLKKITKTDFFDEKTFKEFDFFSDKYILAENAELQINEYFKLIIDYDLLTIELIKTSDVSGNFNFSFKDLRKNIFEDKFDGEEIQKENLFTFVNTVSFRQNFDYNQKNMGIYGQSVYPSHTTSVDSYLNLSKFIFEGSFFYNSNYNSINKNYFRARRTIEQTKSTIALGDLFFRQNNADLLSGLPQIYGLGIFNNELLNPTKSRVLGIDGEFKIKDRSKVEILNKGKILYSSIYGPGDYTIRDLPISLGENDLVIKITSEITGLTETITVFDGFSSNNLISKGKLDYRLGIGEKKKINSFDPGATLIFGSVESLISNNNSLYFGYKNLINKSSVFDFGTKIDSKFAFSEIFISKNLGEGGSAFGLSLFPKFKNRNYDFDLSYLYFSDKYKSIDEDSPESRFRNVITARKSFSLDKTTRMSISASYRAQFGQGLFSLNSILSKRLSRTTSASLNSSFFARGGKPDYNLALVATISLDPETKATAALTQNDISGSLMRSTSDSNLFAVYKKEFDGSDEQNSINYRRTFDSFSINLENQTNIKNKSNNLSLGVDTSLVFTDSAFSINKPISGNSFLQINPSDEDFKFSSSGQNQNITGNVVIPVSPYKKGKALVSPEFSDDSFSLKNDFYSYYVTENSSVTINLDVKKTISITGSLVSENKIPLSLHEGRIKFKDKSLEFMTDENGEFSIDFPELNINSDVGYLINFFLLSYPEKTTSVKMSLGKKDKEFDFGSIIFPVYIKE